MAGRFILLGSSMDIQHRTQLFVLVASLLLITQALSVNARKLINVCKATPLNYYHRTTQNYSLNVTQIYFTV
jgi:hypothetical protein